MKLKIEVWSCTFFSNRWDEKKATCLIIHSWSSIEIKVLYLILIYRKIYKIFCLFNLDGRSTFITTNATLMICNLCIYFCWPIVFFISIQFSMCAYLLSVPLYHMADPPPPKSLVGNCMWYRKHPTTEAGTSGSLTALIHGTSIQCLIRETWVSYVCR